MKIAGNKNMLKEEEISLQTICDSRTKGLPKINGTPFDIIDLSLAAKQLREEKNISCEVYRTACGYTAALVDIPSGTDILFLNRNGDEVNSGQYTTYENALAAAICEAIKLINN